MTEVSRDRIAQPSDVNITAGIVAPKIDAGVPFERIDLGDGAWVEIARGWVSHADQVYDALLHDVDWQTSKLFRYDHWVEERRLGSMWRPGTPLPHPVLKDAHKELQRRYRADFRGFAMLHYRDGRDGQAFHRDTDMRWLEKTIIAVLTFGARRPWHLRPLGNRYDHSEHRGATHDIQPASGDLLVMGGRSQAAFEHSVPYLGGRSSAPRISLQWRFAWRTGKPYEGASWRAPVHYSHRRS